MEGSQSILFLFFALTSSSSTSITFLLIATSHYTQQYYAPYSTHKAQYLAEIVS